MWCLDHMNVSGFVARWKSPREFLGSTGHLHSLLGHLFISGFVFWLEILHIGTLRADIELNIVTSPTIRSLTLAIAVKLFTKRIPRWLKSHASEAGGSEAGRMALKSAGTERAFSLLNILLGSNQDTTLFDYIRGSVVLRYSNTKRANEALK